MSHATIFEGLIGCIVFGLGSCTATHHVKAGIIFCLVKRPADDRAPDTNPAGPFDLNASAHARRHWNGAGPRATVYTESSRVHLPSSLLDCTDAMMNCIPSTPSAMVGSRPS